MHARDNRDNVVNYRIVAERLERAAMLLRDDPHNCERAQRLSKLAEQIRHEQHLPPGFMDEDD